MESYEKFMSLPESEKAKCFEVLFNLTPNDSDSSVNTSRKSLSFETFLSNISNSQISPSEGNARKKQKTLDGWLIKRKDLSTEKDKTKTGESSCALEESASDRSSTSVQSTPDNTNSVSIYENKEYSPESGKNLHSKSSKVNNNFAKNVEISASKKNESSCIVTEKYNLRSKRGHANPSRPRCPCECSNKTDNIGFHKSNKVQTHSEITNICNGASENVLSVSNSDRNQSNNKDCQEVDLSFPIRKSARNKKFKKHILNDEDLVISSSVKNNNVAKHDDLHVNNETFENDIQKETASSLLSNKEAFQILESEFARINLNILDVLKHDKLQTLLNSSESLDNEMYLLFNSFKQINQKSVPVVHLVRSRKRLSGIIKKLQKSV